jgi:phosphoribosylglycinamide formyltransferase-1
LSGGHSAPSIVILISGRGSNMRALIEAAAEPPTFTVAAVISDQAAAPGLGVARDLGVPAQALPPQQDEDRAAYDRRLAAAIADRAPSLLVLAGFMRILSADFIAAFDGRILNIHPALLPKYPGLHTHRRALEAREAEHGATVHFVTAQLDAGPPVIQARVAVNPNDNEAALAARVQAQEHLIYPLAVHWFCEGRLRYRDGKAWLDGAVLERPVKYPVIR